MELKKQKDAEVAKLNKEAEELAKRQAEVKAKEQAAH